MRLNKLVVAAACAVVVACSAPQLTTRDRAVLEQTLDDNLTAWVRAWNNGERDSLAALYLQSPDLTVVWIDGQQRSGWEEEQLAQTALFNSIQRMNLVVQNPQVQVLTPDVAVSVFSHSIDIVRLGGRRDMVRPGSGTIIWVRDAENNVWQIHTAHLSLNPGSTS